MALIGPLSPGKIQGDGAASCFTNIGETGIPALQAWCHSLTSSRAGASKQFLSHLDSFSKQIQAYLESILGEASAISRKALRKQWESPPTKFTQKKVRENVDTTALLNLRRRPYESQNPGRKIVRSDSDEEWLPARERKQHGKKANGYCAENSNSEMDYHDIIEGLPVDEFGEPIGIASRLRKVCPLTFIISQGPNSVSGILRVGGFLRYRTKATFQGDLGRKMPTWG
jgi:hypothetical protein